MALQQISMVMVGAKDIQTIRGFYEGGLGWTPWRIGGSGSVMYKVGSAVLVFLDATYLAKERGEPVPDISKLSFAVFVSSQAAVDESISKALAAGATLTSAATLRDGGIYSGYYADPEGNSWEVAWSSKLAVSENGELTAP